jgi:aryl-alcohol dehydrogenase-like predicted oxidoreductase
VRLRRLGTTGLLVTEQCLGTMTFGAEADEPTSHALLDRYVDAGGNFLDTADVYSRGVSEEIIGRWLARSGRRDDLVIATKARFAMGDGPNHRGLSRAWLHAAVDASLRRLQTDRIDLLQIHAWDPLVPVAETVGAITELARMGKIRGFGVSNVVGWQLERYAATCAAGESPPVATLQPQYNLLERGIEWELAPLCLDRDIAMLPWSPLGGGWLTGKYRREEFPEGATRLGEDPERGVEAWDVRNDDRTWRIVDAVREVAEQRGASPAQVALAWVTDRPAVASTILGARSVEQLDDNLNAVDVRLSEEERRTLDEVSDPGLPGYPYALVRRMTTDRTTG